MVTEKFCQLFATSKRNSNHRWLLHMQCYCFFFSFK